MEPARWQSTMLRSQTSHPHHPSTDGATKYNSLMKLTNHLTKCTEHTRKIIGSWDQITGEEAHLQVRRLKVPAPRLDRLF